MSRIAIALLGAALEELTAAHHAVIAARMRHGEAERRYDREFLSVAGVSAAAELEMRTATGVLKQAEDDIRRTVYVHGVGIGAITPITLNEMGPAA